MMIVPHLNIGKKEVTCWILRVPTQNRGGPGSGAARVEEGAVRGAQRRSAGAVHPAAAEGNSLGKVHYESCKYCGIFKYRS